MHDQADHLRRLVRHGPPPAGHAPAQRPRLVLATGGKGGVGTTTVAVNLAVAAACQGARVVVVDADPDGGHVRTLCSLEERYTIDDLLAARRTLAEVLQAGPGGIQVLSGACRCDAAERSGGIAPRLVEQLCALGDQVDLVLIDAGNGWNRPVRGFWQAADEVLLVTTPDLASVTDAYASVKVLGVGGTATIHPLVNMTFAAADEGDVDARLRRACLRFQGIHLAGPVAIGHDVRIAMAGKAGKPFVLGFSGRRAARQIMHLAKELIERAKQAQASGRAEPIYTDTLSRPCHVKL